MPAPMPTAGIDNLHESGAIRRGGSYRSAMILLASLFFTEGSGLLVMAIAGGALVFVQGWIANRYGLQWSFLLTAACELYTLFNAVWGTKPTHPVAS